jgi:hypothetical protein
MDAKLSVIPVSPTNDSNSFDESQVIVVKIIIDKKQTI